MKDVLRYYRFINILSIDIAAGAVISALYFARIFNVTVRAYGLMALALTVWIIYTADHLRDARNISRRASSERHAFHQTNFKVLLILVICAVVADAVMIFFIRRTVFLWGLGLLGFVGLYLVLQGKIYFLKEITVAVLYTAGIILPSVAVTDVNLAFSHIGLIIQFAAIAFLNLLIFSWFDRDKDSRDQQHSFVTKFGEDTTRTIIWIFVVLVIISDIVQVIVWNGGMAAWIPLLMTLVLTVIFYRASEFVQNDAYRIIGDAVFFIPALMLI
jgi:4-hydroxybenzoate polyprenyltransferase